MLALLSLLTRGVVVFPETASFPNATRITIARILPNPDVLLMHRLPVPESIPFRAALVACQTMIVLILPILLFVPTPMFVLSRAVLITLIVPRINLFVFSQPLLPFALTSVLLTTIAHSSWTRLIVLRSLQHSTRL